MSSSHEDAGQNAFPGGRESFNDVESEIFERIAELIAKNVCSTLKDHNKKLKCMNVITRMIAYEEPPPEDFEEGFTEEELDRITRRLKIWTTPTTTSSP